MSGFGKRFLDAGYSIPKSLIEVENLPIIAHVLKLFPGETNVLFICNNEHLQEPSFKMKEILSRLCPNGKIVGIEPHNLGPNHAVLMAEKYIENDKPVIVNYCDFFCIWSYSDFLKEAKKSDTLGIIPAYKGFHPHSLGKTYYAYILEQNGKIIDIREKEAFTENRMDEYASTGTYYFASGKLLKQSLKECKNNDLKVNGEFYVSLAYKSLFNRGSVKVFNVPYFMQWGTPEDLSEFLKWSSIFKSIKKYDALSRCSENNHAVIIPMAGLGSRFKDTGLKIEKPLITVLNLPMVILALCNLPPAEIVILVVRNDMENLEQIKKRLLSFFPNLIFATVPTVTSGQATSCLAGIKKLKEYNPNFNGPVTFATCDAALIHNGDAFNNWKQEIEFDLLVWTKSNYVAAIDKPEQFSWAEIENNRIIRIDEKKPPINLDSQSVFTGCVSFRNAQTFEVCVESLFERKFEVNGEYYLDSCINDALDLNFRCAAFEIEHFVSFGTPLELKCFEYWENCFHEWEQHPFKKCNNQKS